MAVKFEFEFYEGYMSYNKNKGGFDGVIRGVISARTHRELPTPTVSQEMEIDERFLPVYIFEKYYCKYKRGYYANTAVRYYKIDENGKTTKFKTITKFLNELQKDLDKYDLDEKPIVKTTTILNNDVELHSKFFPDEIGLMLKTIYEMLDTIRGRVARTRVFRIADKLRKITQDITIHESSIRLKEAEIKMLRDGFCIESEDALRAIAPAMPEEKYVEIKRLRRKILELAGELVKFEEKYDAYPLKELKDRYYALLKEAKMLSKSKKEIVKFLARTLHPEYAATERILKDLFAVFKSRIKNHVDEAIKLKEREVEEHRTKLKELGEEEFRYWRGVRLLKCKYYKLYSSEMRKCIIRPNGGHFQ